MSTKRPKKFKQYLSHGCIRINDDFQLYVLSVLGVFVLFAVTPFAIYRYLIGDFLVAAAETGLLILSGVLVAYAWITGKVERSCFVMSAALTFGIVFTAKLVGSIAYFWFFCAIIINFALLKPRHALILIGLGLSITISFSDVFPSFTAKMIFLVTSGTTTLFGCLVAQRNYAQQALLKKIALTDVLTSASNRRASNEELAISISDFKRNLTPYFLIAFDVDHFKTINDTYGHEVGDETLIKLVNVVTENTRPVDRLFRIGGEEFALLVAKITEKEALLLAEKTREKVEQAQILANHPVTISCGIAQLEKKDDLKSWERRADEALYKAKNKGRNCSVFLPWSKSLVSQ